MNTIDTILTGLSNAVCSLTFVAGVIGTASMLIRFLLSL